MGLMNEENSVMINRLSQRKEHHIFVVLKRMLFLIGFVVLIACFPADIYAATKKPAAPRIVNAEVLSFNAVKISWKKTSGATAYRVSYRETGSKKWVRIAAGIKETSYTHISTTKCPLRKGKTYQYTVRAMNGRSAGEYNKKGIFISIPKADNVLLKNAWIRSGEAQYYRKKGVLVNGWRKVGGNDYYFDTTTRRMLKNTVAGTTKGGYHYVDSSGIRVKDPVIEEAVSFVMQAARSDQTQKQKLQACYNYIVKRCHYRESSDEESIKKMPAYADFMFKTHTGNCYRGAVALAYCAKVLGYETRMGIGGVTAYMYRALSTHGWTEVKIDGKWYVCDTSMQRYHPYTNLFLVQIGSYPFRIRVDKHYMLTIKKGLVKWIE